MKVRGDFTNQQQQNHHLRMDSSLSHRGGGGGVSAFHQIFALDSAVVKTQNNVKLAWRVPN